MPIRIYQRKFLPLYILLAAIIILALLFVLKGKQPALNPHADAVTVLVKKIKLGPVTPQIILFGSVTSPRYTKLEAAVTAYVKATPFLSGSAVKAGEIVIYLDDRDATNIFRERAAVVADVNAQLQAEIKRYEIDKQSFEHEKTVYELAKKDVDRMKTLAKRKLVAAVELDKAERELRLQAIILAKRQLALENYKHRVSQIKAKLAQATAQRDQAKLDLERTKIIAPFSGRLINLHVSVGDRVNPGEQLAEIYDTNAIEIHAQVPNRYVAKMREAISQNISISGHTDAYGKYIQLKLIRLGSQIRQGRGAIDAVFSLADNETLLPIGLSLQVFVNLPPIEDAVALPNSAVYNNDHVYKVVNNKIEAVKVKQVGQHLSATGDRLLIVKSQNLKTNDEIVLTNLPNALTGLKIKPVYER